MSKFLEQFSNLEIPNLDLIRLPKIELLQEEISLINAIPKDNLDFFQKLINKGWIKYRENIDKTSWPKYIERIREEVSIFNFLGFTDYCVLVWRTINKAVSLGEFIDAGRGSVCNSLVFFLIGVTWVDPIKHNDLMFARFMSKVRSKKTVIDGVEFIQGSLAPDVDLNLGSVRQEIIHWLGELYPNRVAKIMALSTFTGKKLIQECCKAILEYNKDQAKDISDLVSRNQGIVEDIEDVYQINDKFKEWADGEGKKVYEIALLLRELQAGKGTHASGYYISYDPLNECMPCELNKKGKLTISYDKDVASELGIKMDLLGLSTNQIVGGVLDEVKKTKDDFDLEEDGEIYEKYQDGNLLPFGLYQIGAPTALRVCNAVKPVNINELSDVSAIARPGALAYLKDYVDHANEPPHPIFNEILAQTRNRALYQEQLGKMLVTVGFTPDEAETCRKIVGKKLVEKVKEWEKKIYDKVEEKGLPIIVADSLWKILNDSAKYSFGNGHSLGTAFTAALTTKLKYSYPLEFYTACLNSLLARETSEEDEDDENEEENKSKAKKQEKIAQIKSELKFFNIELLPPHLLKSDMGFKIENGHIRYALGGIRSIEKETLHKVVKFRGEYDNKVICFLNAKEAGLNINNLCGLIHAGALDGLGDSKSKLMLEAQSFNVLSEKQKGLVKQTFEETEYKDILVIIKYLVDKGIIKEKQFETFQKKYEPFKKVYQENIKNYKMATYLNETHYLGFSYSHTLVEIFREKNVNFRTIEDYKKGNLFAAHVAKVRRSKSKAGNVYMEFFLFDHTKEIKCMLFENRFLENEGYEKIKEGDIVTVKADWTKEKSAMFVDTIYRQDYKVVLKSKDLAK